MPIIQKQKPVARPVKRGGGGSLLESAVDVSTMADEYIKMVIYGKNRVGKTTLACEFPKPLLLLSFEPARTGGAQSVKHQKGVKIIRVRTEEQRTDEEGVIYGTTEAYRLAEELKQDTTYRTLVLDTATSWQDIVLQEILGRKLPQQLDFGLITQVEYRDRSSKLKEALRPFMDLDKHVVILAQEKDHNPPKEERNKLIRGLQDESFFASDLGSAATKWLHDNCDYIGHLYQDREIRRWQEEVKVGPGKTKKVDREEYTGKFVRRLRTMYHLNYAAGFRSANPETVPEYIEGQSPKAMFDAIMKVIEASK